MAIPVVVKALTTLYQAVAPSLQNLSWQSWRNAVKLVEQIEKAREQMGETKTWNKGRSLLKTIKHWFDRQRTSWWPPDKDKAKRKFIHYMGQLQSSAQAEIQRLQQKAQAQVGLKVSWKRYLPYIAGGVGVLVLLGILAGRKKTK